MSLNEFKEIAHKFVGFTLFVNLSRPPILLRSTEHNYRRIVAVRYQLYALHV